MLRIYIAGSYSSPDTVTALNNIGRGIEAGRILLEHGFAPFCPWLDCLYLIGAGGHTSLTVEDFKGYGLQFVDVSDALCILPNSEDSAGTQAEIARANSLGIPVYHTVEEIIRHRGQIKHRLGKVTEFFGPAIALGNALLEHYEADKGDSETPEWKRMSPAYNLAHLAEHLQSLGSGERIDHDSGFPQETHILIRALIQAMKQIEASRG